MVDTTQATMRQDFGHVAILEHQYHSAAVYLKHVAHIVYMVVVVDIVIGAALEQ